MGPVASAPITWGGGRAWHGRCAWPRLYGPGVGVVWRAADAGRAWMGSKSSLCIERFAMGYGRSNRYGRPRDAGAQAVAETSAFLSWALSADRQLPAIPRRRVDQGGFSSMMRRPMAGKVVAHWWSQALERLADR